MANRTLPPESNSEPLVSTAPSFLAGDNAAYIEALYARYLDNPSALDTSWQHFFGTLDQSGQIDIPTAPPKNQPMKNGYAGGITNKISANNKQALLDSLNALMLIRAYRIRGHLTANLDPLGIHKEKSHPELDPKTYGFSAHDMDRPIFLNQVLGLETATAREILDLVQRTYCGTFALQYMHISDPEQVAWLKERIEGFGKEIQFTRRGRKAILHKIIEAEEFEVFLHHKYVGTKRFGLDGGESLIPAMEQIIKRGGALGIQEIVIGMPHRGRLSMLANVMGKPYKAIFHEFKGGSFKPEDVEGSGDVKYHLGASADRAFDGNNVHLSLTANPSHLEAVNPVVLGKVRAKQQQLNDTTRSKVLPVLLHGDAAFAGQGVVAECFAFSGVIGHRTGGTVHIIINNQIGFTTAPHFSRSSNYPTDIALMVEAPIFHVNGDDPEAVVHAAKIAVEFRQKFHKDVVIDMFCYRRFGHNESDEPSFTNPLMYQAIRQHPSVLNAYKAQLVKDGSIPANDVEKIQSDVRQRLNDAFAVAEQYRPNKADWLDGRWANMQRSDQESYQRGETGIAPEIIKKIGKVLYTKPLGFNIHNTINRLLQSRKDMFDGNKKFDWATAEALAFGSLLLEGYPVRLSGQDSGRGTFSQRHSALVDQTTEKRFYPLNEIDPPQQAKFEVIDSLLSEYAVLGFEYGYSLAEPNTLTLWEAQFGDFANGAQIMLDQFIASGEAKWLRMSGLTMLLPHGFEGQGPEHSSARLERFLQLSAENNWIIANCTTPANYFHILRRQMHRSFRKPLVIMTPKSLLRHKQAMSDLAAFTTKSSFHRILSDDGENTTLALNPRKKDNAITTIIMCSGKVYFDLLEKRNQHMLKHVYLLRIEQLYPFPMRSMIKELKRFGKANKVIWCQEEPRNQGAWRYCETHIEWALQKAGCACKRPIYEGRPPAAAPASGLLTQHKWEQNRLVNAALGLPENTE